VTENVFITAAELADLAASEQTVSILDIRFDPSGGKGREQWKAGHIPGAVYVDLATELAGPAAPGQGRRPLPDPEVLQESARRWGIRHESDVVVYDDRSGLSAGRAWWVLRWAGIEPVRILNGGLDAWVRAGFPLTSDETEGSPGDVVLRAGGLPVLDAELAASIAGDGVLIDARDSEQYRQGHIPGALSRPSAWNLGDDGTVTDVNQLRAEFAELGVQRGVPVGAYCGGGVAGAFEVAVLRHAGIPAALYPGSWSAWSSDPQRPAVTGDQPGTPVPHDPAATESEEPGDA
jgi:thiosulfate/3-mercaptopyruvate sulfurtransferase